MEVALDAPVSRACWSDDRDWVRLELALAAGQIGCFDWDVRTGVLRWDERLCGIVGIDPSAFRRHADEFYAAVVDEDRARVRDDVDRAVSSMGRLSVGYRIRRRRTRSSRANACCRHR